MVRRCPERIAVALALLAGFGCGGARTRPGLRYTDAPAVDLGELTGEERRVFLVAFNEMGCPCGEPHSLARCVHEHRDCRLGPRASAYVAKLVREGSPEDQIAETYRLRFGRLPAPPAITIEPTALDGPADAPVTLVAFSDFQ